MNSLKQALLEPRICNDLQISRGIIRNCLLQKCVTSVYPSSKSKGKVIVTDKKYRKNTVEIIESKKASVVLKRINYENFKLFGKIISTGTSNVGNKWNIQKEMDYPDEIIQHETCIPIKEWPGTDDQCSPHSVSSIIENHQQPLETDPNLPELSTARILNDILDFPLLNMVSPQRVSITNDYINQINCLRKYLQSACGGKIPSVSKILEKTMPHENVAALEQWRQKMIQKMGKEAFEKHQERLLFVGSSLHDTIKSFLSGKTEENLQIIDENIGHWKSIKNILQNVNEIRCLEDPITHPFLLYRGVVDCFAKYRDNWCAIEWKTSKRPKSTLASIYDYPLQIAAYAGALNFDPRYQYMVKKGLIVIAYEGGVPASVHHINESLLFCYWNEWLKRLKLFYEMECL